MKELSEHARFFFALSLVMRFVWKTYISLSNFPAVRFSLIAAVRACVFFCQRTKTTTAKISFRFFTGDDTKGVSVYSLNKWACSRLELQRVHTEKCHKEKRYKYFRSVENEVKGAKNCEGFATFCFTSRSVVSVINCCASIKSACQIYVIFTFTGRVQLNEEENSIEWKLISTCCIISRDFRSYSDQQCNSEIQICFLQDKDRHVSSSWAFLINDWSFHIMEHKFLHTFQIIVLNLTLIPAFDSSPLHLITEHVWNHREMARWSTDSGAFETFCKHRIDWTSMRLVGPEWANWSFVSLLIRSQASCNWNVRGANWYFEWKLRHFPKSKSNFSFADPRRLGKCRQDFLIDFFEVDGAAMGLVGRLEWMLHCRDCSWAWDKCALTFLSVHWEFSCVVVPKWSFYNEIETWKWIDANWAFFFWLSKICSTVKLARDFGAVTSPSCWMEHFSIITDNEISSCFGIGDCSNSIKPAHHRERLTVLRFMYTTRLIASLRKRANCVAFLCPVREHILIDTTNFFPWTYGMLRSGRRLNAATTAKSWRNNQTFLHASTFEACAFFRWAWRALSRTIRVCLSDIADGLEWIFFSRVLYDECSPFTTVWYDASLV